jgi:glycosyltransferase involved in cell wall biosynthesis
MKRVLFLVNHHLTIYNFRRELVERLLDEGYEVFVSSPYGKRIDALVQMGCQYVEMNIDRHGINPIDEFRLLRDYIEILKHIQPNVVLTYTVKPNIYGNLACKKLGIPSIANVTGLGTAIENSGVVRRILIQLYRVAFSDVQCVFFQNKANEHFFIDNRIDMRRHRVIPGSGVNLIQHCFEEYPVDDGITRFLFIGRIMKDKGIEELVEAATTVTQKYENVQFDAVGFYEEDYKDRAEELESSGVIKFHGVQDDVHEFIRRCNAVVLPSYHEGMANVLLEAASTGRPVLASSIPGCMETFDEGISGFGFKPKDPQDLESVLIKFINLPYDQKRSMGIAGRQKMEREFNRNIVVDAYLEEIDKIINT